MIFKNIKCPENFFLFKKPTTMYDGKYKKNVGTRDQFPYVRFTAQHRHMYSRFQSRDFLCDRNFICCASKRRTTFEFVFLLLKKMKRTLSLSLYFSVATFGWYVWSKKWITFTRSLNLIILLSSVFQIDGVAYAILFPHLFRHTNPMQLAKRQWHRSII